MPRALLLYFPECPHVDAARAQLGRAFAALGLPPDWSEVDVTRADAPPALRAWASPTILVDGRDVVGAAPGAASACRLYPDSEERGAPPLERILAALRRAPP